MNAPRSMAFVTAVSILSLAVSAHAQLSPEWLSPFYDAANSSSNSVTVPDSMGLRWSKPSSATTYQPLVSVTSSGEQLLISGKYIYDPWTGALKHTLPIAGNRSVITRTEVLRQGEAAETNVLLAGWPSAGADSGYVFAAYDLDNYTQAPLWTLDPGLNTEFSIVRYAEVNAYQGVFYIGGYTSENLTAIAAVRASDGVVLWETGQGDYLNRYPNGGEYSGCAVGTIKAGEDSEQNMVFATFSIGGDPNPGILALDAETGDPIWWDTSITHLQYRQWPTLDATRGLVYTTNEYAYWNPDTEDFLLLAYDVTSLGESIPKYTAVIDGMLNGPPTLGMAQDNANDLHDAVFVVTNPHNDQATIYAFKRGNLEPLWKTIYPHTLFAGSTYSDGRLYIMGTSDGRIHVFDANTGSSLPPLPAQGSTGVSPAIVEVLDLKGEPQTVLYYNDFPNVYALGYQVPPLTLAVIVNPTEISIGEQRTEVSATLSSPDERSVTGFPVTFSSNAASNQGYLASTTATTDTNGVATTEFVSQKRDGVVQISASIGSLELSANVDITITKTVEPPPPTDTGSIQGVVYTSNGKPARKVLVTLTGPQPATTTTDTTSSPQGKYTFEGLTLGTYIVSVDTGDEFGSTESISLTSDDPNRTDADINLTVR